MRQVYRIFIFLACVAAIVAKCVMFHYSCFGFLPETESLTDAPVSFWSFWLPKLTVALVLSLPLLLTRRTWWSVVMLLVIDLWIVANLLYFRANNLFLSLDAIRMASNLRGFGSSLSTLIDGYVWAMPLLTAGFALLLVPNRWLAVRTPITFGIFAALTVCCWIQGSLSLHKVYSNDTDKSFDYAYLNPFVLPEGMSVETWQMERQRFNYIVNHSIISYSVNMLIEGIEVDRSREHVTPLSEAQRKRVEENCYNPSPLTTELCRPAKSPSDSGGKRQEKPFPQARRSLVIILIESLESWVLEMHDANGQEVTPCINRFRREHPDFYCHRVVSEVMHGVSGDGQLLVNTGLMPIQTGAACMLYPYNIYPGIANMFPHSVVFNPVKNAWNKTIVMRQYGYNDTREPADSINRIGMTIPAEHWWDESLYVQAVKQMQEGDSLFCSLILTLSSHMPFNLYDHYFDMPFSEPWPEDMRSYLGAIHYTDYHLGKLLEYIEQSGLLERAVVLITGDHIVFKSHRLPELTELGTEAGISLREGQNYVPMILVGDGIAEDSVIEDEVYQMDIYPTLLSAIGCYDEYLWRGFGVDLLQEHDGHNRHCRIFDEDEAYMLSDKMICSDFFGKQ